MIVNQRNKRTQNFVFAEHLLDSDRINFIESIVRDQRISINRIQLKSENVATGGLQSRYKHTFDILCYLEIITKMT